MILSKLNEISGNKIKEISLIYDLSDFFKLKEKYELSLKENRQDSEILKSEIDKFIINFKGNKASFFTGKGFITFQNFKYAKSFKDVYNFAYRNYKNSNFLNEIAGKSIKKFQNTVKTKIMNKNNFISKQNPISSSKKIEKGFVSKYFSILFKKDVDVDQSQAKSMRKFLGNDLKIKRGTKIDIINWNFSAKTKLHWLERTIYFLVIQLFLPLLAYWFNYIYFYYDIGLSIKSFNGVKYIIYKFGSLVITIFLDQIAFFFIDYFFYKSKFMKSSNFYTYMMFFYSFYILTSNIILPNFAMKYSFKSFEEVMSSTERVFIISKLKQGLYLNYFILIFSGMNYKVIKPLLFRLLKKSFPFNKNDYIIFSLSYVTNCLFYVFFYGSITPVVRLTFLFYIVLIIFIDFVRLRTNKDESSPDLPITVFSTTALIIISALFIVNTAGVYGISSMFEDVQTLAVPEGLLQKIFYHSKYILSGLNKLIFQDHHFLTRLSHGIIDSILESSYSSLFLALKLLLNDLQFFICALLYSVCLFFCWKYFNNERLFNRIQSRIWKGKKTIENLNFEGKSYREANPAYSIDKL